MIFILPHRSHALSLLSIGESRPCIIFFFFSILNNTKGRGYLVTRGPRINVYKDDNLDVGSRKIVADQARHHRWSWTTRSRCQWFWIFAWRNDLQGTRIMIDMANKKKHHIGHRQFHNYKIIFQFQARRKSQINRLIDKMSYASPVITILQLYTIDNVVVQRLVWKSEEKKQIKNTMKKKFKKKTKEEKYKTLINKWTRKGKIHLNYPLFQLNHVLFNHCQYLCHHTFYQ